MGYRIVYGADIPVMDANQKDRTGLRVMTAAFFLIFVLLVRAAWPAGAGILRQKLMPGNETVAEMAFSEMVNDLHQGIPMGEAVKDFCRYVVENGEKPLD
jgi:hypothetical protein